MTTVALAPFAPTVRGIDEPDPGRAPDRRSGPDLSPVERGPPAARAEDCGLVDGEYQEAARSVGGMLRSSKPWPFEADLRALAQGRH